MTPTSAVSGTTPSFTSFSVPFTSVSAFNKGSYLAQTVPQDPHFLDSNSANNKVSGFMSVVPAVLPVNFLFISATVKNCMAGVEWKVASQVDLRQYEMQYGTDGIVFKTGVLLPPNASGSYSAKWPVGPGTWFFRVKASDLDGSYRYSATVSARADCSGGAQGGFMLWPNPVPKAGPVTVTSLAGESTAYRIMDALGRLVREGRFMGSADLWIANGGTYIVDLHSASAATTYKLVVQ